MEPGFAGSSREELDYFLATFVTPFLKANGYRKSAHTYRKAAPNGDQVSIQFRGWALGEWCTFLLIASAMSEPLWDCLHFESGKTYPARRVLEGDSGGYSWRVGAPGSRPTHAEPWSYSSVEKRRGMASALRDVLYADVLPYLHIWLDRDALLARTPPPDADWRRLDGFTVNDKLRLAVLAAQGPSEDLDQLMEEMNSVPENEQALRWAAVRSTGGPTWAEGAYSPCR